MARVILVQVCIHGLYNIKKCPDFQPGDKENPCKFIQNYPCFSINPECLHYRCNKKNPKELHGYNLPILSKRNEIKRQKRLSNNQKKGK